MPQVIRRHRRVLWTYLLGAVVVGIIRWIHMNNHGIQDLPAVGEMAIVGFAVYGLAQLFAILRVPLYYKGAVKQILRFGLIVPVIVAGTTYQVWRLMYGSGSAAWIAVAALYSVIMVFYIMIYRSDSQVVDRLTERVRGLHDREKLMILPPLSGGMSWLSAALAMAILLGVILRVAFRENVAPLVQDGADRVVIDTLAAVGYTCAWHWYWFIMRSFKNEVPNLPLYGRLMLVVVPVVVVGAAVWLATFDLYALIMAILLAAPVTSMVEAMDS